MNFNEFQWSSMNFNEVQWFNEGQWISMKFNELQWSSMKVNELQWSSMKFNEVQWTSMKFNEVQWFSKQHVAKNHETSLSQQDLPTKRDTPSHSPQRHRWSCVDPPGFGTRFPSPAVLRRPDPWTLGSHNSEIARIKGRHPIQIVVWNDVFLDLNKPNIPWNQSANWFPLFFCFRLKIERTGDIQLHIGSSHPPNMKQAPNGSNYV